MGKIKREGVARLDAPVKISSIHDVSNFNSGKPVLDDWLKKRALANNNRTSQTFVICREKIVLGYYALAAGSIERAKVPGKLKRNTVDPIPAVVLGRLAIDQSIQNRGIGGDLLRDAVLRSLRLSAEIGFRAILVHAIDDDAALFYRRYGFLNSPIDRRTLMLPLDAVAELI